MLSLLENAALLDDTFNFQHVASLYPADVIMRARAYRDAGVVIGAYSASQGVPIVRDEVAQYITGAVRDLPTWRRTKRTGAFFYSHVSPPPVLRLESSPPPLSFRTATERDGHKAHPNDIFLTSGASEGITLLMGAIIANPSVGVMIPIPQYPLYSATITLCDGVAVGYYLVRSAGP